MFVNIYHNMFDIITQYDTHYLIEPKILVLDVT